MDINRVEVQVMPGHIEANTYEEFVLKLHDVKVSIRSRRDGRQQDQLEYWVIQRYLPLTITKDAGYYHLEKRESPDFELIIDDEIIGLEVTESTCEQFQELLNYVDRNPDLEFEYCNFRYGKEFSKDNLYKLLQPKNSKLTGPGWGGFEPESFASQWARDSAFKKMNRMLKWSYSYKTTILLYDNTPTICKKAHFE